MPRFIDHHPTGNTMPPEVVTLIRQRLRRGRADEFGEREIGVFIGTEQTYCYSEAPSVDAVVRSHAARGIFVAPANVDEIEALP